MTRIKHYKGGEYAVDPVRVKVQVSEGDARLHDLDPLLPPRRIVKDGDELIVYRLDDGSMAFGRFPDEMVAPRFETVPDKEPTISMAVLEEASREAFAVTKGASHGNWDELGEEAKQMWRSIVGTGILTADKIRRGS